MKKITSLLFISLLTNLSLSSQDFSESSRTIKSLSFKENKGQVSDQYYKARPDILFSGNQGDLVFHLKNNGISYQLNRVDEWTKKEERFWRKNNDNQLVPSKSTIYRIDINWLNTNASPEIIKGKTQQGYENYYLASCPEGALEVKSYSDLTYKNLYPGIDLKWYEKNGALEYDYYVAANSDYKKIQLEYRGAEKIYIDRSGALIIKTPLGIIKEQKPLVMQGKKVLEAKWVVRDDIISFDIKNANSSLPLIIDPLVRLWGTYYGGAGVDDAWYTNVDAAGNVFISGSTKSAANIATSGAHQSVYGGLSNHTDAYLVKFNSAGVRQWATYYGGSGDDYAGESIADASGNVFLTGGTTSTNTGVIATPGSHQPASTTTVSLIDAFLVMFNAAGVRQWGTYYGGDAQEVGYGLSLDNSGNIYMVGASQSTNAIATPGSHQSTITPGSVNSFVVKFNSSGVRQWGTYYGGNGPNDLAWDCATNSAGDTYVSGVTSSSTGISTPGSHQPAISGPTSGPDGFLAKFNSSGVLQWGTYYGGNGTDDMVNISLDAAGNIYGAGSTGSSGGNSIASVGSHQPNLGGGGDAYLVKFDPTGTRVWGTYYGGAGNEFGYTAHVDAFGNVFLAGEGSANSTTAVATPCAYQSIYGGGGSDGILAKFTSTGARLWSTYYGSTSTDHITDCRSDAAGNIYVCGITVSTSTGVISSSNGFQTSSGGGQDAFLAKLDRCFPGTASNTTPLSNLLVCTGNNATLNASCANWYSSPTGTLVLGTGSTFTAGPIVSDSTFYLEDFGCGSITGTRTAVSITVAILPTLTVTNNNPLGCIGETITLTALGASTYTWINTSATTSTIQFIGFLNTTYTVTGADANGCQSTAMLAVVPNLCLGINEHGNINSSVSIYPNPNNGAFTIQSGSNLNLLLTNELGQIIRALQLTSVNNFNVTLNDLPNGIYFLKGEKENYSLNKKIIVIR